MTLNNFLRYTAITSVFALFFTPFIVANGLFFPFITGKAFFFRIVVEIGFAAWLLLSLRDASVRPKKSWILWALVAFVAATGLADIFGADPWKSFWSNFERMEGYITILHLFAYFIVATSVLQTEKLWNRWLGTAVGSSVVMTLYCLLQLAGVFVINQGGVRVDGRFGNATYLAIYLVFSIFFTLIMAVRVRNVWGKISLGAVVALHSIVLYHTATRGSMLGLLGGIIVSCLLIALFDRTDKRARIVAGSIVAAVALLIGGFLLIRNASFVQQSPVLSRFASISLNDTKTQARAFIWPMAWQGFKNDPLLGSGQENFNYIFNANYNPAMYHHEQWFDRAHNVVLDWLTAGGLLGLLTYLSLFVATLWLVWKRPDISFIERALLSGLLAAYFFHNLFVFDNLISYILFGSVLAYVHFKSTKLERPWGGEGEEFDDSDMRTAGPLVLIVLCFCIYFLNWRGYQTNALLIDALRTLATTPVQADAALASFQRAVSYDTLGRAEVVERLIDASGAMNSSSVPLETRQKFFELTRSAVEKQTKRVPDDARYRVFAGSFYGMYGDYPKAEEEMLLAAHLSPNKQSILYQLGNLYVAEKAYDKAVAVYKQAYDAYPQNDDAARFYAMALTYAGKEAEAHTFLESRIGNESMTSDIFLQAYADTGNWTKVVSLLKTRIAANPSNMEDRKNLAAAYLQLGDKADAIATFREMITIDPSFKAQGEAYIQAIQQGK